MSNDTTSTTSMAGPSTDNNALPDDSLWGMLRRTQAQLELAAAPTYITPPTPAELSPCRVQGMIEEMKKGLQDEVSELVKIFGEPPIFLRDFFDFPSFRTVPLGLIQEYAKMLGVQVKVEPLEFKDTGLTPEYRFCPGFKAQIGLLKLLRGERNPKVLSHFETSCCPIYTKGDNIVQSVVDGLNKNEFSAAYAAFGLQQSEKFQVPDNAMKSLNRVVSEVNRDLTDLADHLASPLMPYLAAEMLPGLIAAKRLGATEPVLHSKVDNAYTVLCEMETPYFGFEGFPGRSLLVGRLTAKLQLAILHGSGLLYDDLKPAVPKVESQTAPFSGAGTNVNGPVSGTGYNGNGPVEL